MQPPSLILITDTARFSGESFFRAAESALANGVDAILVREKEMTSARLLALASRLRGMTRSHGARLLIHSQADVARAVDADGVHVASRDLEAIPAIRNWLHGEEMSLSASCHSSEELLLAGQAGADFALLAPVFPTPSHPGSPALGVEKFQALAAQAKMPVLALGGITADNRDQLAGCGLAVISAVLAAADPGRAARQLAGRS
ncbi:MAG: thiamine phosphate synthase [Elusimicrobiales bacterium]|nr:thiamine phosphate synthase [Elusimicrobiales bacterium]